MHTATHDVVVSILWQAASVVLVVFSWKATTRLAPESTLSQHLIGTIVLSLSCIIGSAILLGSVGWLYPLLHLILAPLTAALFFLAARRFTPPRASQEQGQPDAPGHVFWLC